MQWSCLHDALKANRKRSENTRFHRYVYGKTKQQGGDPSLAYLVETWEACTESENSLCSPRFLPKELSVELFKHYNLQNSQFE